MHEWYVTERFLMREKPGVERLATKSLNILASGFHCFMKACDLLGDLALIRCNGNSTRANALTECCILQSIGRDRSSHVLETLKGRNLQTARVSNLFSLRGWNEGQCPESTGTMKRRLGARSPRRSQRPTAGKSWQH